ncbi:hypothetical protein Vadar_003343 [Vaccinium darrowii]|uniref:Uncharacterized protein n=1 Tax=Vaccinium darrowii TaxID=229202 RepID=A0ACB7Y4Q4_9ERIC|nr:hypothetical protein Vadar_003343 [Vaccinium darrowii]
MEVGLKLGSKIGTVEDVAIPAIGSKDGRFVQARVYMDISVPLQRGCMDGGHELLSCDKRFFDIEEDELRDAQYGPQIRASPATQPSRNKASPSQARQSSFGESSMVGSGNSAADKADHNPNSF